MKKTLLGLATVLSTGIVSAVPAFANAPGGGYEGITAMYYITIGVVLAYGVYDIFFKKS